LKLALEGGSGAILPTHGGAAPLPLPLRPPVVFLVRRVVVRPPRKGESTVPKHRKNAARLKFRPDRCPSTDPARAAIVRSKASHAHLLEWADRSQSRSDAIPPAPSPAARTRNTQACETYFDIPLVFRRDRCPRLWAIAAR